MRNQELDNPFGSFTRRTRRLETMTQTPTKKRRTKEAVALKVPALRM